MAQNVSWVPAIVSLPSRRPLSPAIMFNSKVHIEAGDVVIVYMVGDPASDKQLLIPSKTRDNMLGLTITPGEVLHNKYGRYPHDNMMGMKFGSKASGCLVKRDPTKSDRCILLILTPAIYICYVPRLSSGPCHCPIAPKSFTIPIYRTFRCV